MSSQSEVRDRHVAGFGLIETLRWQPGAGFVRLERHLARLAASAAALGFAWSEASGMEKLRQAVETAQGDGEIGPLRIRLELAADGGMEVAALALAPLPTGTEWQLRIASTRLDSENALLRHKVTARGAYDAARAEFARHDADEVILLNERREVCEGTITSIFVDTGDGGPLRTPAIRCGLLPGVLRSELIDQGRAVETVLAVADLERAKAVLVGNSLRGLIAARLR
jgi:4-amino-4-deoxychorismate lyase